ncbi:MAG: patatin-like phospholipase family protein [Gammaproteobacteria bacterium]
MRDSGPRKLNETGPFTINQVLLAEVHALRPHWLRDFVPEGFSTQPDDPERAAKRTENLRQLYRGLHGSANRDASGGSLDAERAPAPSGGKGPLSALCLSGGGIRSATFNLGVVQCLAQHNLLGQFDYLSSVSGGGYIAGWLRTWMRRVGTATVLDNLREADQTNRNPLAPEAGPIDGLREYSNYLTPRLGLFSGDTWSAVAIVVRNLILNWLVVIPLLASVIALPLLFLLFVKSEGLGTVSARLLLVTALAIEIYASVSIYWRRRFTKQPKTPQSVFLWSCAFPVYLASGALSWAAIELRVPWLYENADPTSAQTRLLLGFAVVWCIVIPVIGWLIAELRTVLPPRVDVAPAGVTAGHPAGVAEKDPVAVDARVWRRGSLRELCALVVSGAIAAALLIGMVNWWLVPLYNRPVLYVVLAMPLLLALYLLARTFFIAIASISGVRDEEHSVADEADREWWARLSGWVLLIAVGWVAVTTICFLGGYLLELFERMDLGALLKGIVAALGGASGMVAAFIGGGAKTAATDHPNGGVTGVRKLALAAAAPLFAICVIIAVGWGTIWLGELVTRSPGAFDVTARLDIETPELSLTAPLLFLAVPPALCALALLAGLFVNVNRFSLHGLYRNRLVRAYLGASNLERKPDPFTGFALEDNVRLHDLWHEDSQRPLPIINATLNLVSGAGKLAWQQRKAESFSMTPFYCGNFHEGYRRSRQYGGFGGISVGTAVTISGAAANPNMGFCSSPVLGFLLTLFNARLGAWLGNTNRHGNETYEAPGPRQAVRPLLAELFGLTTNTGRYVNLSDGGHFDNLGLYEVVLRRCQYILASDAGQDDKFAFEDLGNAIRKIRIDLGISIVFQPIRILPRSKEGPGLYCALANVRYSDIDGDGARDGKLIYIKPTLRGGGEPVPYDVYSYAESRPMFPHEPTADQWFTESQFESYRALGLHVLEQVSNGGKFTDLTAFMAQAEEAIKEEAAKA